MCNKLEISFKGITSRICWLLFVDAAFKTPRLKVHVLLVAPHSYSAIWQWVVAFLFRVPHFTACALLLAGGYTPLTKG